MQKKDIYLRFFKIRESGSSGWKFVRFHQGIRFIYKGGKCYVIGASYEKNK